LPGPLGGPRVARHFQGINALRGHYRIVTRLIRCATVRNCAVTLNDRQPGAARILSGSEDGKTMNEEDKTSFCGFQCCLLTLDRAHLKGPFRCAERLGASCNGYKMARPGTVFRGLDCLALLWFHTPALGGWFFARRHARHAGLARSSLHCNPPSTALQSTFDDNERPPCAAIDLRQVGRPPLPVLPPVLPGVAGWQYPR
jgi:hypothetical protein